MTTRPSLLLRLGIPIIALGIGILLQPWLSLPSLTCLQWVKGLLYPANASKEIYVIELDDQTLKSSSVEPFSPIFSLFERVEEGILFAPFTWDNFPEMVNRNNSKFPFIGSVSILKGGDTSSLPGDIFIDIPARFKLPTATAHTKTPRAKIVGILPPPFSPETPRHTYPLIYRHPDGRKISLSGPLLAFLSFIGEDPKRVTLKKTGLSLYKTGIHIPLSKEGEMLLNVHPFLSKQITKDPFPLFQKIATSRLTPREHRDIVGNKITILLPPEPSPQKFSLITGQKVSSNQLLLQALNTLLAQEFIHEWYWMGWLLLGVPLVLISIINPISLWFALIAGVYGILALALFIFGGLILPFISAEVSAIIMAIIPNFFFRYSKKPKVPLNPPEISPDGEWGKFHIISKLGQNPRAVVYRAQDRDNRRSGVLKVFREALSPLSYLHMSYRRRSTQKIGPTYIVPVYELGRKDPYVYLFSEDTGGRPLSVEMEEGPIEIERSIGIFEAILKGLEVCHDKKLVHGNLKPSNLLMLRDGSIKLSDFGWATIIRKPLKKQKDLLISSLIYLAPEQFEDARPTPRSDLYAAGVIAYEMITGQPPFQAKTIEKLIEKKQAPTPRLRDVMFEVPVWLDDLIQRLIARKPADRILSATQALEILHVGHGR